jgi:ABC-type dipeptide/oligopeptide/nickel transport system permease subunit
MEAVLGYIGVNLSTAVSENEFTVVSWGGLFYTGRSTLTRNPMLLFVPALSLLLLSMSFVLIGDYFNRKHTQ